MALYMESTKIAPTQTAAEICKALVAAGATQINQQYEGGKLIGLRWTFPIGGREIPFAMPARVEPVYTALHNKRRRNRWAYENEDRAQAERVAWRPLLRWVQAQLAMIETGMVAPAEVFLPYVSIGEGTLYQQIAEKKFAGLLPAAGGGHG